MIKVIFIDEHDSSKHNGIGTYRDTLVPRLGRRDGMEVTMISLNSDWDNLKIEKRDYGYEYSLPRVAMGDWRGSGDVIWPLISMYIPDGEEIVFMFNHSPSADFIRAMKGYYPKSKTVFVIHDQGWCASLMGDARLLEKVLRHKAAKGVPENVAADVRSYCEQERDIYGLVDRVVCLSDSTERVLRDEYGLAEPKLVRIENGYETSRRGYLTRTAARERLRLRPDDEVLLFVARPARHKGIEPLLKALPQLVRQRPYLKCVLAGSPAGFSHYWNLAGKVASNVIMAGYQSPAEMREWYAAADVGVLSSYTEQCSYAALEMMSSGITIVTSDGNGLRDMFTDGEDALVVPVGNVMNQTPYAARLAEAIDRALMLSPDCRRAMSVKARKVLRTCYSAEFMSDSYATLFGELISDSR